MKLEEQSLAKQIQCEAFAQALVFGVGLNQNHIGGARTISNAYRVSNPATINWKNNSVNVEASKFLALPYVALRVQELRNELAESYKISKQEVLAEFSKIARFDPRKLYDENGVAKPIHELDDETAASINSVEVVKKSIGDTDLFETTTKIKVIPKTAALDSMGKHYNAYEDHQKSSTADVHIHLTDKDDKL